MASGEATLSVRGENAGDLVLETGRIARVVV
jgi:hypothetical protein